MINVKAVLDKSNNRLIIFLIIQLFIIIVGTVPYINLNYVETLALVNVIGYSVLYFYFTKNKHKIGFILIMSITFIILHIFDEPLMDFISSYLPFHGKINYYLFFIMWRSIPMLVLLIILKPITNFITNYDALNNLIPSKDNQELLREDTILLAFLSLIQFYIFEEVQINPVYHILLISTYVIFLSYRMIAHIKDSNRLRKASNLILIYWLYFLLILNFDQYIENNPVILNLSLSIQYKLSTLVSLIVLSFIMSFEKIVEHNMDNRYINHEKI
jgi:hypothetical protein